MVVGDWNGDGWIDVATTSGAPRAVDIYWNQGNGQLAGHQQIVLASTPAELMAGDFNADGKLDLATVAQTFAAPDELHLLMNDGAGNFSDAQPAGFALADDVRGLAAPVANRLACTGLSDFVTTSLENVGQYYGVGFARKLDNLSQ